MILHFFAILHIILHHLCRSLHYLNLAIGPAHPWGHKENNYPAPPVQELIQETNCEKNHWAGLYSRPDDKIKEPTTFYEKSQTFVYALSPRTKIFN